MESSSHSPNVLGLQDLGIDDCSRAPILGETFFQETLMAALQVGPTGAVQGRLPHGWHIAARFNREMDIVEITSPDTDHFSINVDTSKLDEYSSTHKPALGVLEDACLEAKYDTESGVLRYDTAQVPEFWLEVRVQQIMKSKNQVETTSETTSPTESPPPVQKVKETEPNADETRGGGNMSWVGGAMSRRWKLGGVHGMHECTSPHPSLQV